MKQPEMSNPMIFFLGSGPSRVSQIRRERVDRKDVESSRDPGEEQDGNCLWSSDCYSDGRGADSHSFPCFVEIFVFRCF